MEAEESVQYKRADIVLVLRWLSMIVVSLDRLGSCGAQVDDATFQRLVATFVIDWNVTAHLARMRRVLSDPFPSELGADDKDELERKLAGTPHWSWTKQQPPDEVARFPAVGPK